eukprot:gene26053-49944_t
MDKDIVEQFEPRLCPRLTGKAKVFLLTCRPDADQPG